MRQRITRLATFMAYRWDGNTKSNVNLEFCGDFGFIEIKFLHIAYKTNRQITPCNWDNDNYMGWFSLVYRKIQK